MPTEPLIAPVPDGVNVTDSVHLADLARAPPQGVVPLPAALKSALAMIELIVTVPVLLLVTVTVFAALVAPMPVAVKVSDVGLKVRATVGPPVPLPVSATTCGLNAPLVAIARPPLAAPVNVGAKVTMMVQFAPPPSDAPQVPPVTE